jgi:hypothetical protein
MLPIIQWVPGSFTVRKTAGAWGEPLTSISVEDKPEWSCTSMPAVRLNVVHRDSFTLTLPRKKDAMWIGRRLQTLQELTVLLLNVDLCHFCPTVTCREGRSVWWTNWCKLQQVWWSFIDSFIVHSVTARVLPDLWQTRAGLSFGGPHGATRYEFNTAYRQPCTSVWFRWRVKWNI